MALTLFDIHDIALQVAHRSLIYGADPVTIARVATAIAWVESKFDPSARAKCPKGKTCTAAGLMQITAATQRDIEKLLKVPADTNRTKIFDPRYAMILGINRIGYQWKRYKGDWNRAVIAYNQGSYNTSSAGGTYLSTWLTAYRQFESQFPSIENQWASTS